ncbi:MAG: patatin-like phospholipase/acyl hydrolase [Cryomorphaceae bacterium]|jgi:patatin-like phospholipase/acyl hydrolase
MSYHEKLKNTGQKKLLALDGGGIRGLVTIEVLAKIEAMLRETSGEQKMVLSDYFDYVAGTSTGAVIGTLISLGKSTDEIRQIYLDVGEEMFHKNAILARFAKLNGIVKVVKVGANMLGNKVLSRLNYQTSDYSEYRDTPLIETLQELLGKDEHGEDIQFSSTKLKTLLMMVLSNADTDSPWPVTNNPKAKYNDPAREDCNSRTPLWQMVRASSAAPTVFPPQRIKLGKKEVTFVDGGITPYNNPAFQLFIQSTLKPYKLEWPTGEQKMLIVSIGTGQAIVDHAARDSSGMDAADLVETVLDGLMNSSVYQQDLLCRAFGKCVSGDVLDDELGNLTGNTGLLDEKLFTYARYNIMLSRKGLDELGLSHINPKDVSKLDSIKFMGELQEIGKQIGEQKVQAEHFADFPHS